MTTAVDGSFPQFGLTGSSGGQLVVVGGIDQSTGLPNTFVLTAPYDAAQVSPLTTLVNNVMQQTGVSELTANTDVCQALGISSAMNLDYQPEIPFALAGDTASAQEFAQEVQVSALLYQVTGLLGGTAGAFPATVGNNVFASLAATIAQGGGTRLDLSQETTVESIVESAAAGAAVTLDPTVAAGAATVIANVNAYMDSLPVTATPGYLTQLVQAQVVGEGTIAPELAQVGAGTAAIGTVVADNSGAATHHADQRRRRRPARSRPAQRFHHAAGPAAGGQRRPGDLPVPGLPDQRHALDRARERPLCHG